MRNRNEPLLNRPVVIESLETRAMLSAALAVLYPAGVAKALPVAGMNHVAVKLKNIGDTPLAGNANVTLFASADSVLDENDLPIASSSKAVSIAPRRGAPVKLNFTSPGFVSTGEYFLIAEADVGSEVVNVVSKRPTQITQPFSDLAITVDGLPEWPVELNGYNAGDSWVYARVRNAGNVKAFVSGEVNLYLSSDTTFDAGDALLSTTAIRGKLQPGQSRWVSLSLTPPAGTAVGGYFVIAELVPTSTDQVSGNNISVSTTRVAIVDHLPRPNIKIINYYDDGGYEYYYDGGYYTYDDSEYYYDDGSSDASYDSAPVVIDNSYDPPPATDDSSAPAAESPAPSAQPDPSDFGGGTAEFDDGGYYLD